MKTTCNMNYRSLGDLSFKYIHKSEKKALSWWSVFLIFGSEHMVTLLRLNVRMPFVQLKWWLLAPDAKYGAAWTVWTWLLEYFQCFKTPELCSSPTRFEMETSSCELGQVGLVWSTCCRVSHFFSNRGGSSQWAMDLRQGGGHSWQMRKGHEIQHTPEQLWPLELDLGRFIFWLLGYGSREWGSFTGQAPSTVVTEEMSKRKTDKDMK